MLNSNMSYDTLYVIDFLGILVKGLSSLYRENGIFKVRRSVKKNLNRF